jgi:hypothetical protein
MILYHVSPLIRVPFILADGLLTACSEGAFPVVWLHTRTTGGRIIPCIMRRHGREYGELGRFRVKVPIAWLSHYRWGVYRCWTDIPPERIEYLGGILK